MGNAYCFAVRHRHEDHAGVAAAMTDSMMRAEMHLIKDMAPILSGWGITSSRASF